MSRSWVVSSRSVSPKTCTRPSCDWETIQLANCSALVSASEGRTSDAKPRSCARAALTEPSSRKDEASSACSTARRR